MALSEDVDERLEATRKLQQDFTDLPDKEQGWKTLIMLTKDEDINVQFNASLALGIAFRCVTDNEQTIKALLAPTKDRNGLVRFGAVIAISMAFRYFRDKEQRWKDLLALTKDEDELVRIGSTSMLGIAFQYVTDKQQATKDFLALTKDEDSGVRRNTASALGLAFPHFTDKDRMQEVLFTLTTDEDSDVRSYANHSLGKILIIKATEAKEKDFKTEFENALECFEKSTNEATVKNPAKFCLPFYRSFHAILFRREKSQAVVKKSIKEAKEAVGKSNKKQKLLEAIENLSNALKEVYKARSLGEIQGDLTAYSRYCNRASELLGETEKDTPMATMLVRKGLPIINQHIKTKLAEIEKNAKEFCKETRDTLNADLGTEIHQIGKELSNVRDPISLEKAVENMQMALSILCKRMPEEVGGEACEILTKAKKELYVEDKLNLINMIFPILSTEYKIGQKLDELLLSIKSGISEELVISVGSKLFGTGVEHVIHIPLQEISYPELKEDLERIKGKNKLASYPIKLASKIKEYLIRNKKDDLLNKLS